VLHAFGIEWEIFLLLNNQEITGETVKQERLKNISTSNSNKQKHLGLPENVYRSKSFWLRQLPDSALQK